MGSTSNNVAFPKSLNWAIAAPFIIVQSLWLIAYFLRIDGKVADALVYGVRLIYALSAAYIAIVLFRSYKSGFTFKYFTYATSVIFIVYAILFSTSFFQTGLTPTLKSVLLQFLINCVPAVIIGAYCASFELGKKLLHYLEFSGFIFIPASIVYVARFFVYKENIYIFDLLRIGKLDYMMLSYALLPLMICSIILAISDGKTKFGIRITISCIYFTAILFSQTRGAFTGFIFGMLFILFFHFRTNLFRIVSISVLYTAITLVVVQFTLPKLLGDYNVRFSQNYLEESLNLKGGVANSLNSEAVKVFRDNINTGILIDESKNICTIINTQIAERLATDNQFYQDFSRIGCNIKLSRMSLIVTSVKEIQKNPMFGIGPLAFMEKYYGFHPHNIPLELLTEVGIIFGSVIIISISGIFILFLFGSAPNSGDQNVSSLLSSFIPMFLVSGTFWGDAVLSFFMAYACVFALRYRFERAARGSHAATETDVS